MSKPSYVCHPGASFSLQALSELWAYRHLLWVFVKRDLKIRYRYTILGGLWSLIQPLSMMIIFSLVFSRIFHVQTGGAPYPLFSYSALIIWQAVSRMLNQGGTSLSEYSYILSKVYFPRALVPLAVVVGASFDFLIAFGLLLIISFVYGFSLSLNILWLPFILLLPLTLSVGLTLWLSALDLHFRDIRAALPFLMQVWMFATPIMYPVNIIPSSFQIYYYGNPLVVQVELFRWSLLGGQPPHPFYIALSGFLSLTILLSGILFFQRVQGTLIDRI